MALGVPIPLHSLRTLAAVARIAAPIVVQLPFKVLYPTSNKQEQSKVKYSKYYHWAEIMPETIFLSADICRMSSLGR